jgi:hypothetical protein
MVLVHLIPSPNTNYTPVVFKISAVIGNVISSMFPTAISTSPPGTAFKHANGSRCVKRHSHITLPPSTPPFGPQKSMSMIYPEVTQGGHDFSWCSHVEACLAIRFEGCQSFMLRPRASTPPCNGATLCIRLPHDDNALISKAGPGSKIDTGL